MTVLEETKVKSMRPNSDISVTYKMQFRRYDSSIWALVSSRITGNGYFWFSVPG